LGYISVLQSFTLRQCLASARFEPVASMIAALFLRIMQGLRSLTAWLVVLSAGLGSTSAAQVSEGAAVRAASARVSPGDRILLHVTREPELNDSIPVTERGEASFPKLGRIQVASLTISELQDTLFARYSQYLRSPVITVKVLRRIVVQGQVRMPSIYYFDINTTLRDAIARAGGLTVEGHPGKVDIIRGGRPLRVKDWEREGGSSADLLSGDQIVVGRKHWLVINAIPAISTAVVVSTFVVSLRNRN
jgi:protein involved in polysaccharide export with SLBB domain